MKRLSASTAVAERSAKVKCLLQALVSGQELRANCRCWQTAPSQIQRQSGRAETTVLYSRMFIGLNCRLMLWRQRGAAAGRDECLCSSSNWDARRWTCGCRTRRGCLIQSIFQSGVTRWVDRQSIGPPTHAEWSTSSAAVLDFEFDDRNCQNRQAVNWVCKRFKTVSKHTVTRLAGSFNRFWHPTYDRSHAANCYTCSNPATQWKQSASCTTQNFSFWTYCKQ